MRDVAVVGFTQSDCMRLEENRNEVEILLPVLQALRAQTGVTTSQLDFVCSGSSDYLAGQSFAFIAGLDAVGAWPPVCESHVEMDGAWALYEAWVKIQTGDANVAMVYGFGKASLGDLPLVMAMQLDPYSVMPLWPDAVSLAALQARIGLESGAYSALDMAKRAAGARKNALANPHAQVKGDCTPEELLTKPMLCDPLRKHDCPPISDGASAVLLAAGARARELCERPAWIRGFSHICEPQELGVRDLTLSKSTQLAAQKAGVFEGGAVDCAELSAPFTHQQILVERALGIHTLSDGDAARIVNPSGGALAGNPIMAVGLSRIGEAAARIWKGAANRAVAHATSGPCLQQNLVCLLEGE